MYVTVCGCSLHSSQGRSLTQSTPRLPLRWARPSPAPFFGKLPLRSNQDLPLRMHQQRYRATSSPSSPAGNGKGGESPSPQVVSALVKVYSALKTLLGSIWELLTSPITAIKHSATWRRDQTRRTLKEHADRDPRDATAQAMYLRELVKADPKAVILRVESRRYNNNAPGVVAAFVEALGKTGEVWKYVNQTPSELQALGVLHTNLQHLLSDLTALAATDRASIGKVGTAMNPMQVQVQGMQSGPLGQRPGGLLDVLFKTVSLVVNVGMISFAALIFFALLDRSAGNAKGGINNPGANPGVSGADSSLGFGPASFAPKQYNKDVLPEKDIKTFKDVCGCPEAKAELEEIVEFLKDPNKFTRLGAKLPKGVMLYGPPGTGKTLLAKAVAGEAGVPFFYRAGSEFEEMYVGVGSRRVRSLFQAAKKASPCIVFIDEIDAIGGSRKALENQAARKTLNQLLVEMDGFDANEGIIVMAATNIPDSLDPALTRPGRFDRHVNVPLPDVRGRSEILSHYLGSKPVAPDVDSQRYARATPGFSGADLFNLVNEAALTAAKMHRDQIESWMLDEARDKVSMGAARKSAIIPESERRNTAFHEAGHALVALQTKGAMPIHKATIIPRGHALGMVQQVPDDDYSSMTVEQMHAKLDVCMGGRVAEHLIFGWDKVSAGASNDLWQASRLARAMVTQYGLSPAIGPVSVPSEGASTETQRLVDDEVRRLLNEAYGRVERLLTEHKEGLSRLAEALLQHETLTGDEVKLAVEGSLVKAADTGSAAVGSSPAHAATTDEVEDDDSGGEAAGVATRGAPGAGGEAAAARGDDIALTSLAELMDLIRSVTRGSIQIEMRRDGSKGASSREQGGEQGQGKTTGGAQGGREAEGGGEGKEGSKGHAVTVIVRGSRGEAGDDSGKKGKGGSGGGEGQ